tara:strand:+ start:830 stop:1210 length:381 start_codon:yes stop_codon:yes gene_type:complete
MDLKDLKPKSDLVVTELMHPGTGDPLLHDDGRPFTVTTYATHSKGYKEALYEQANRRIKQKDKEFKAEDVDINALELLSNITTDWDIIYDGKPLKLTKGKAKEVYDELFWIRNQVEDSIGSFEAFT